MKKITLGTKSENPHYRDFRHPRIPHYGDFELSLRSGGDTPRGKSGQTNRREILEQEKGKMEGKVIKNQLSDGLPYRAPGTGTGRQNMRNAAGFQPHCLAYVDRPKPTAAAVGLFALPGICCSST